jgi:hypothetical protein
MHHGSLHRLALAATALLAAGCASTDYHWSQLDGTRYHRTSIDTYPVMVVRVDDRSELDNPVRVDPGARRVTVQAPPGRAQRVGELRSIDLQVAPCTRYYLVALKTSPLTSDFTVRIDHQEPVAGCTPPKPS